ncbi:hypothetical protein AB0H83_37490 [Dactylosporangium sp. NPDC050688]|uniref:hypothetical protein n=1 Tax=Dactylosporangium sp. NPDC050688 TaxID=3157217 RepID=UPI0033CC40B9
MSIVDLTIDDAGAGVRRGQRLCGADEAGPRRRAQPMVRAYCDSHDLPYAETGLFGSYRHALLHLHTVGRVTRMRRGRSDVA